jgi:hypothetical protein
MYTAWCPANLLNKFYKQDNIKMKGEMILADSTCCNEKSQPNHTNTYVGHLIKHLARVTSGVHQELVNQMQLLSSATHTCSSCYSSCYLNPEPITGIKVP